MGINTSLSLQESWHLPPSSISLDGQTFGSQAGPRDYSSLSSFLSSLPLSFSPFSQFTHVPSTRGTTNGNGVSDSAVKATPRSQTPYHAFENLFHAERRCVGAPSYVSTEHGDNYNRGGVSGKGPTRGGPRHWRPKKNDRDSSTLNTGNSLHVHSCR